MQNNRQDSLAVVFWPPLPSQQANVVKGYDGADPDGGSEKSGDHIRGMVYAKINA